jgi:arsenate reductase-like glutaredoxin family protein
MSAHDTDFMGDWQALARQSWDAWSSHLRQAAPTPAAATGNDTVERTLEGLKSYFQWMQAAAAKPGDTDPARWSDWLQRSFSQAGNGLDGAFAGMNSGTGTQSFDAMMRQWAEASPPFAEQARHWLHLPAFGAGREQQEQQQQQVEAMLEYSEQYHRYQALIARANLLGVERMQRKLATPAAPGRQVESLRTLYDLWVDCAEEAYAEIALSPEFREVYGELVNAQMRVRSLQQDKLEQWCQQTGLPTRSEVNTLGERLQALRREVRAAGDTALAAEVAALRREVAALRKPSPAAKKKPAKRAARPAPGKR